MKQNKILIVVAVILSAVVLSLGGYLIYDKAKNSDLSKPSNNEKTEDKTQIKTEEYLANIADRWVADRNGHLPGTKKQIKTQTTPATFRKQTATRGSTNTNATTTPGDIKRSARQPGVATYTDEYCVGQHQSR